MTTVSIVWDVVSQKLLVLAALLPITAVVCATEEATSTRQLNSRVDATVELNYYTTEAMANVVFDMDASVVADGLRARVEVDGLNDEDLVAEVSVGDGVPAIVALPIRKLPVGEYPMKLGLLTDGETVWQGTDTLIKRSPPAIGIRVVQVDRVRRILLIDGKPWFPMGVFGIFPEHLQEASDAGFNVTLRWKGVTTLDRYQRTKTWDDPANRAAVCDYLDQIHQVGMYAVETPVKLVEESMYVKFRDAKFHEKYPIVNDEITPGVINNASRHPAVIAYYSYDEPDNFYPDQPDHPKHLLMQKGVEDWYERVHSLDPYHPVMTLFAVGLSKVENWNAWDVAMRDFYISRDQHMSKVYDTAIDSAQVAWQLRTPFVYTPLFEKSSGRPVPLSPEEQRAQTYLSIVADVKGLFYWDWPAAYAPNWGMLKQLAGEVKQLAPVLLEGAPSQHVSYSQPDTEQAVKAILKNHQGSTCLIAVNAEPAPVDVTYQIQDSYHGKVDVLFEDRSLDVARGRFTDRFEPYDRRVYFFRNQEWRPGGELELSIEIGEETDVSDLELKPSETNLIVNDGFEADHAGLPGWPFAWHPSDTVMESGVTDTESGGRWAVVEDQSHHGDRSMRLIKTTPGIGNSDDAFNLATTPAVHQQVTFPAAGTYVFSAWMKANRKVRTWMMVGWDKFVPIEVGTDWKQYQTTVNRNVVGNSFARIYLMQQGTLWVDSVQLRMEESSTTSLETEATYENGALKLDGPLPLREHERVKVRIQRH